MDRATQATIARALGVHVSTVSRALSSDPAVRATVAHVTAAAVQAEAERRAYRLNLAGAALRTGRTRLLGVLVPRLTDIVLAETYEGIDHAAAAEGYFAFVSNTEDDPDLQRKRVHHTLDRGVDGLLLGDARNDSDLCRSLVDDGVPLVLFHRRLPGIPSAYVDDASGAGLAAAHLAELGCSSAAVVAGPKYASTAVERTAGFMTACQRLDINVRPDHVMHGGFGVRDGRMATELLLQAGELPDAIFAVNDFNAIGVMGALRDAGAQPGRDVALIGYNDVPLAAELPIPLTSVKSPLYELGEAAVGLLLRVLRGEQPTSVVLDPTLRVRESSVGRHG